MYVQIQQRRGERSGGRSNVPLTPSPDVSIEGLAVEGDRAAPAAPARSPVPKQPATPRSQPPTAPSARQYSHESFSITLTKKGLFGGKSVDLEMIAIPGGKFWMGSPDGVGDSDERPRHEVTIAPFFMGKYTVTQAQYEAVMGKNPSGFKGDKRPVERVSWHDAIAFCQELSKRSDRQFSLPSEAQWEYACRAGTETEFYFGETISTEQANYDGNYTYGSGKKGTYREQTTDVGSFPANKFGLQDMHGNVWEWCADHWHGNYKGAPKDGSAWITGSKDANRLLRGSSWLIDPDYCRSAFRNHYSPDLQNGCIGFRVVCV
jgi:formylglycine-generating enzyme required for sulfatase activity